MHVIIILEGFWLVNINVLFVLIHSLHLHRPEMLMSQQGFLSYQERQVLPPRTVGPSLAFSKPCWISGIVGGWTPCWMILVRVPHLGGAHESQLDNFRLDRKYRLHINPLMLLFWFVITTWNMFVGNGCDVSCPGSFSQRILWRCADAGICVTKLLLSYVGSKFKFHFFPILCCSENVYSSCTRTLIPPLKCSWFLSQYVFN